MRTVVIGGMQFMGRRIVELLLERGDDVAVLHRRAAHDLGPRVKNLQADRADLPRVTELLRREKPDAVFDLVYDWAGGTPASHVEGAARACGDTLQRYVYMSSIAAYPQGSTIAKTTSSHPMTVPIATCSTKHRPSGCCSGCIEIRAFRSSRSGRRSCMGHGSCSIASSSSGIGCSTAGRSCFPTAAVRRCSGCSPTISPRRVSVRSRCPGPLARRSIWRTWNR